MTRKHINLFTLAAAILSLFTACRKDDDLVAEDPLRKATVTYLVTPNGLGDNSYNDAAAEGIFAFIEETNTRLRLLLPDGEAEARVMFEQWLDDNATRDSSVLILGSSVYEAMAREVSANKLDALEALQEHGGRVLLFECDAEIEGISTVMVSRYGVSYLAGAMSQEFDALILAALCDNPVLEEFIRGFVDGHTAHRAEGREVQVRYLSDNEGGFAMPDSAYRFMDAWARDVETYDDMIFPLLGGSEIGVIRHLNDDDYSWFLMVGMDVDQAGISSRIPFSVVIQIGDVLRQCLYDWHSGQPWPKTLRLGMADGAVDIAITPNFFWYLFLYDERYADPDTFQKLYDKYKDEAVGRENEKY